MHANNHFMLHFTLQLPLQFSRECRVCGVCKAFPKCFQPHSQNDEAQVQAHVEFQTSESVDPNTVIAIQSVLAFIIGECYVQQYCLKSATVHLMHAAHANNCISMTKSETALGSNIDMSLSQIVNMPLLAQWASTHCFSGV